MNRINNPKYKGALIQYLCSECNYGGDIFIEFTSSAKVKSGNCEHFILIFYFHQKNT